MGAKLNMPCWPCVVLLRHREVTDGGHSVDSTYGDSLEEANLAEVVGASLVRTVCVAACGGFVLGWLPGVLLLEVLQFNFSFFPTMAARLEWWASPATQLLQIVALVGLVVWRACADTPLARARAQLMCVEKAGQGDEAREEAVKDVMVAVGWSHFVQGVLGCWVLISALTFGRVTALLSVCIMWLVLDAWDLAPFGLEVALARLLPDAANTSGAGAGGEAQNAWTHRVQAKKAS